MNFMRYHRLFARALFVVGFAVSAAPAHDGDTVAYEAMGAPAEPKVSVAWNRYYDYAETTAILKELAETHPERAKLITLGRSYGNRELWLLIITDFEKGPDAKKPGFWLDGGIHANEVQGTQACLYTAWFLLESHGRNAFVTDLVDSTAFYIMPMMSPDSRDAHMHRPNSTHTPRSGQRPRDDDRDGLVDEDGPDDLDGDGYITQMRVRDPHGQFKPHPKYPNLMIPVEEGEQGEYRLLGVEGFDNDGDGLINEDSDGYYDPNRDWAWNWQPSYVQRGAAEYPFSVLENRAAADFIMERPNIAGAQSFHNCGGMILRGPGVKEDAYERADVGVFDVLGKKGEKILPNYGYKTIVTDLYTTYGNELDWLYFCRGIIGFTNEMFSPANYFQRESAGFFGNPEDKHAFDKYLLLGQGIVPWREVDHPQYGKVEVGGFRKEWTRQPPSFLLEEECHRNMAFVLYHASELPSVEVGEITTRSLGGDLHEVTAVLLNPKVTPTRTAWDAKHNLTPPDIASLRGKKLKVLSALTADEPFFRKPEEQTYEPARLRLAPIRRGSPRYCRWLVSGSGRGTISVESIKGGRATSEFDLGE